MKMKMYHHQNQPTAKSRSNKFSRHLRAKTITRRINKSENRDRILENTMRGYFNYSI